MKYDLTKKATKERLIEFAEELKEISELIKVILDSIRKVKK